MTYNQIMTNGTIAPGTDPAGPRPNIIRNIIFSALNSNGFTFNWTNAQSQPYSGVLDTGVGSTIDLYIYAWRISNGGRPNLVSEKRIQIRKGVNDIGFIRPTTTSQKTLLLGIYDSPHGTPIFAAWDATSPYNIGHSQKSCQVQVQDLQAAIPNIINQCTDTRGNIIYTFLPDSLGDYIDLVQTGNILTLPSSTTGSLTARVKKATLPHRKTRVIKSTADIMAQVSKLSDTEKEAVYKQRIGQGLFKDLLKNKYGCKCALCSITTENMLVASHIKEWSASTDTEKLDENNGILLCAHHDALFDKHLISFDNYGALLKASTLTPADETSLDLASIPMLSVSPQMIPYLTYHRGKLK